MLRLLVAVAASALAAAAGSAGAAAERPLRTAIMDPAAFAGAQADVAFARTAGAGASSARLVVRWSLVAPREPTGDRTDPANAGYDWSSVDREIAAAVRAGLSPIVCITHAPLWARDAAAGGAGTTWPKPAELAAFAAAAARRYAPQGVHVWQIWNEPNARSHLNPQYRARRAVAAPHYRQMLNAAATAVRSVDADATIVAGALAPFGHLAPDIHVVAPLRFMREVLCVSRTGDATCRARSAFDVWGHNAYTNGGPTQSAAARDDASIGDLPEVRRILAAASNVGHVVTRAPVELWVTEFAWDTKPPDPDAVPAALHARWVAEALYRMWQSGVTLVTWWRLRDDPMTTPYQSGLYRWRGRDLRRDVPKASLAAFRFPFVAFARGRGVYVWGRVPPASAGTVVVELRSAGTWRIAARLVPDRFGIVEARLATGARGYVRARIPRVVAAVPFSLSAPRARRVYPFGCGGAIRCGD